MKKSILLLIGLLVAGNVSASETCEDTVDMADSLDFSKLHMDCGDEAVTLYDPKQKMSFLGKKAVNTYSEQSPANIEQPVSRSVPVMSLSSTSATAREAISQKQYPAGTVINIRESFSINGGPYSALTGLFSQMAHYCPDGWEKLKEWAEPAGNNYFLYFQFQCAE